MSEHTKETATPWRIGEGNTIEATWEDGTKFQVCLMSTTRFCGLSDEAIANNKRVRTESAANAELIVRAVNAHAELVEALKRAAIILRHEHRGYHGEVFIFDTEKACCEMGQVIINSEAALRKAGAL